VISDQYEGFLKDSAY